MKNSRKSIVIAFFSVALSMVLSACSFNNPSPKIDKRIYSLQTEDDGDFGVVDYGKSKVLTFTFTNNTSSSVSSVPVLENSSAFKIMVSYKCAVIEPGSSCMVRVAFSTASLLEGTYEDVLTVADKTLNLKAVVPGTGELKYKLLVNASENLTLNPLSGLNIKVLNVQVKNDSPFLGQKSSLSVSNNKFVKTTGCENVQLRPGKSCFVRVIVKGENINSSLENVFSFDQQSWPMTLPTENVVYERNMAPMDFSVVLGDFHEEGEKKYQVLQIKNLGQGAGSLTSSEITLPSSMKVTSNNCLNVAKGRTCFIRILYENPDQSKDQYDNVVDLGEGQINLIVNQVNKESDLSSIELTGPSEVKQSDCSLIEVTLKDQNNSDFIFSQSIALTSTVQVYSDNACVTPAGLSTAPFSSWASGYVKLAPGTHEIKISKASVEKSLSVISYAPVQISPATSDQVVNSSATFTGTSGKPPYVFTSNVGSVVGNVFTAPASGSSASVKVTDALGQEAIAVVTLHPGLALNTSACSGNLLSSSVCNITSTGGFGSRTYSVNQGSISPTGQLTLACNGANASQQITVTDSLGNAVSSTLTVTCVMPTCRDILDSGYGPTTGVYWIDPDGATGLAPFQIVCEQDTDGGGWDVIQLRNSSSMSFEQGWVNYWNGFGTVSLSGNYWVGNYRLNKLAPEDYNTPREIYIKYRNTSNVEYFQRHPKFAVKDASDIFRMSVSGLFTGNTIADGMSYHTGYRFSTFDSDYDVSTENCASQYRAGWWYGACHTGNINGVYGLNSDAGFIWLSGTSKILLNRSTLMVRKPIHDYPRSCVEAIAQGATNLEGNTGDGFFMIDPDGRNVGMPSAAVYCDIAGGGWMLINDKFPVSKTQTGCNSGNGLIDANGYWRLSANQNGGTSSTHGGCGVSLRTSLKFSQLKVTNSSFTANANCGSVNFPDAILSIVKDFDGPVKDYEALDEYYPGWNYISLDAGKNPNPVVSSSSWNQSSTPSLANGTFLQTITLDNYYIHMGVGAFTGCLNRPVSARIWVK